MPKKYQFSNANRQKLISYSCSTPRKTCNSKKIALSFRCNFTGPLPKVKSKFCQ